MKGRRVARSAVTDPEPMAECFRPTNFGVFTDDPVVVDDDGPGSGRPRRGRESVPLAIGKRFGGHVHNSDSRVLPLDEARQERLVVQLLGDQVRVLALLQADVELHHGLRQPPPQADRGCRRVQKQEPAGCVRGARDLGGDDVAFPRRQQRKRVRQPQTVHFEEQHAKAGLQQAEDQARAFCRDAHVARLAVLLRAAEPRRVEGDDGQLGPQSLQALPRRHVRRHEQHALVKVAHGRGVAAPARREVEVGVVDHREQHDSSPPKDVSCRLDQPFSSLFGLESGSVRVAAVREPVPVSQLIVVLNPRPTSVAAVGHESEKDDDDDHSESGEKNADGSGPHGRDTKRNEYCACGCCCCDA